MELTKVRKCRFNNPDCTVCDIKQVAEVEQFKLHIVSNVELKGGVYHHANTTST